MFKRQQNTGDQIDREITKQKAIQLRIAGAQFQQIADQLQCSRSQAHKLVSEGLEELKDETTQQAEVLRSTIAARLDAMLIVSWDKARRGDMKAIDMVRKIEVDRAHLFGLSRSEMKVSADPGGGLTVAFVAADKKSDDEV